MTKLFNDPALFADDMLVGFVAANRHVVRAVRGGVVRVPRPAPGKVAVVIGGGSGHYPAFCGTVGPGFADGAVVGNIFTSPSTDFAYCVAKAAEVGGGVVFSYGNYAGDVMNFGLAEQRLNADGIPTKTVLVTDDVASATVEELPKRRGIAGDFTVFKVLSAAAEEGLRLDEVVAAGELANDRTRSLGVAFDGCTMPGADHPLFTVPKGKMGVGLGIHGEPGVSQSQIVPAQQLAELLVDGVLAEEPADSNKRITLILNGLGRTKYEELFIVYKTVDEILTARGYTIVEPEVGELVTSLDMAGCSLTITWLTEDLERWWKAPALSAAYIKGAVSGVAESENVWVNDVADESETAPTLVAASEAGQKQGRFVAGVLTQLKELLVAQEDELGRIDAVAGDGDHGRGMVKGAAGAVRGAGEAVAAGADGKGVLKAAGRAWASDAGGTSGVLWGAGLESFGAALPAEGGTAAELAKASKAFLDTILALGKAHVGDKTMIDALAPFVTALEAAAQTPGATAASAWNAAAPIAVKAAADTAALRPKVGRARPLAERSIGTPDAGATSMGMIITVIGEQLNKLS